MVKDLRIQTKTFQLMQWLLPKSEKFPKFYRSTLTQRIMDTLLDFQDMLSLAIANAGAERKRYLRTADAKLASLRSYLRLITDWHWLSVSQYEHVSTLVSDIGKMLGAWLNLNKAAKPTADA